MHGSGERSARASPARDAPGNLLMETLMTDNKKDLKALKAKLERADRAYSDAKKLVREAKKQVREAAEAYDVALMFADVARPDLSVPIQGALDQLLVQPRPNGEVDHYLEGFDDDYDSWVWISEETYQRIRHFLLDGTENHLAGIEGFMASDGEGIPFGARVSVVIDFEDRTSDDSAWVFVISPAGDAHAAA